MSRGYKPNPPLAEVRLHRLHGSTGAALRRRICELSEWTGIVVDEAANLNNGPKISSSSSSVDVFVIPTNEEIVIAHATRKLVLGAANDHL